VTNLDSQPFRLTFPRDPARVIRGIVDGPRGFASACESLPHVIVLHGFKGFMNWGFFPEIARRIAARDMIAVRFNMSGSGIGDDLETFTDLEGFSRNTYSRELEDLERVRAWIASGAVRGGDVARCALVGHSRGGGVALLHGAEHDAVRSIVTWAAISTVDRFDAPTKAEWRRRGSLVIHNARTNQDFELALGALEDVEKNSARFDIVSACRRIRAPTLLIHGSADETVPVEEAERLHAALDPKLARTLVIAGGGHTFGVTHPPRAFPEAFERVADATLAMLQEHWT
jgi:pimeloyl-ACP methyl ester carboxylesterase